MPSANSYFTLADEQAGYPRTRAALATYTDAELIAEYTQALRDGLGAMFGHNARRFGYLVTEELLTRGIIEIPNLFGPLLVRPFRR